MTVNWHNPYINAEGRWHKGNLHAHCLPKSPCASMSMNTLLNEYTSRDYDFLSISDHLAVTLPEDTAITFIPGLEWNSRAGFMPNNIQTQQDHIGVYGIQEDLVYSAMNARTLPELLNGKYTNLLKIANHPDWLQEEHFDIASLMHYAHSLDGMEIYNFSIEADIGQADTTWKWDRLLSMGYPLLGFAHDDSHSIDDVGRAWLMVRAEECSSENILLSLKTGNFYCSTGVIIQDLERQGSTIRIGLEEECIIRAIGSYGRTIIEKQSDHLEWNNSDHATDYIRFHIRNSSWQQAWSQPFFFNPPTPIS